MDNQSGGDYPYGGSVAISFRRIFIAAALPLTIFLYLGLAGIDFGRYWDDELMFDKVRNALQAPPTLIPVPSVYDYPSVTFAGALSALAPDVVSSLWRHELPERSTLLELTRTHTFQIRVRTIYLFLTSLAIVWIAGMSLALGGSLLEAFVAATVCAVSWEVGYHARYVAPDGMMMQFGAMAAFGALAALQSIRHKERWLALAICATGCACGTKYSAWPLVIPLAATAWWTSPAGSSLPARARRVFASLTGAVLVYLITTPGTLLQPALFSDGILYQLRHYATGHEGYTIESGATHLWRMAVYLGSVIHSPYTFIAVAITVGAVVGSVALWRQSHRLAFIVLGFPIFYVLYFSIQKVMIVRNLLIVVPFLAVLAARGVFVVASLAQRQIPAARSACIVVVAGMLALNGLYGLNAAQSIRQRTPSRMLREFVEWERAKTEGSVLKTRRLHEVLAAYGHAARPPGDAAGNSFVAFLLSEDVVHELPANRKGFFSATFGPRDVNLDYYPDWSGDDRVLVLPIDIARRFGIAAE